MKLESTQISEKSLFLINLTNFTLRNIIKKYRKYNMNCSIKIRHITVKEITVRDMLISQKL